MRVRDDTCASSDEPKNDTAPGDGRRSTPDAIHDRSEPVRLVDRATVGWWLFACALAVVSALVVYLGAFAFGLFLYYTARPLARYLRPSIGATATAAVAVLGLVVPVVCFLLAVLAVALGQLAAARRAVVECHVDPLVPTIDVTTLPDDPLALVESLERLLDDGTVQTGLDWAVGAASALATASLTLVLVLSFAYFLLRDERRLAGWFRAEIAAAGTPLYRYLARVDRGLQLVYFGNLLTILVVIVLSAVLYTGLNVLAPVGLSIPVPVVVAVLTGIATFVPLIGRSIVYLVVVTYLSLLALRTDPGRLWFPIAFSIVMAGGLDSLIRYVVRPYLAGRAVHTGLTLFAYLLGAAAFGWYGVFLGPLVLIVGVEFVRTVFPTLIGSEGSGIATRPDPGDVSE